jgi:ribonucleoside-diphosphate reductase subunit M2
MNTILDFLRIKTHISAVGTEKEAYLASQGIKSTPDMLQLMTTIEKDMGTKGLSTPWTSKVNHGIVMGDDGQLDSKVYSMFPLTKEDEEDYEDFCTQEVQMWTAKELDYPMDKQEYPHLKPRYQQLYKDCLGFFAPGDGLISKSALRFVMEAKTYTSQAFLFAQLFIEAVHSESYGMSISSIIPNEEEQAEVFRMVDELPCVQAKAQFIKDLCDSDASPAERALAAACCEGVFFVTLFAIIFYLRDRGVMKTFALLNKQVSIDETLHRKYYVRQARKLGITYEKAVPIIKKAVEIEVEHMKYILRQPIDSVEEDELTGITIENLTKYAQTLGDQILQMAQLPLLYNVTVSLPWMSDLSVQKRSNFYETQVSGYKREAPQTAKDWRTKIGAATATVQTTEDIVNDPESLDF